jgi:hypothetical protein
MDGLICVEFLIDSLIFQRDGLVLYCPRASLGLPTFVNGLALRNRERVSGESEVTCKTCPARLKTTIQIRRV